MKFHFPLALSFAAPLLLAFFTAPAPAQAKDCNRYAKEAVSQNRQNSAEKCGFNGLAWHNEYGAHFAWCLVAPASQVRKEARKRAKALTSCLLSKGGGGSALPGLKKARKKYMTKKECRTYAAKMERLQRRIEKMCNRPPQASSFRAELRYCRRWPAHKRRANANASLESERLMIRQGRCL